MARTDSVKAATVAVSAWAWVGLGSNVGNRGKALHCLRAQLTTEGVEIVAASAEVLTRPVGVTAQPDFHNQVLLLRGRTALAATEWLRRCQQAEDACGRRATYRWGPRRADADVILLGRDGRTGNAREPSVPHPQLGVRSFWRRLIAEIDPLIVLEPAAIEPAG